MMRRKGNMMRRKGDPSSWILLGVAAALVAVVLMTALGFYLTRVQFHQIEKVLFDAAIDNVRGRVLPSIDRAVRKAEAGALEALRAHAASDRLSAGELDALHRKHPAVATPFVLSDDFKPIYPPPRSPADRGFGMEDTVYPSDLRRTLALLEEGGNREAVHRALQSIYGNMDRSEHWRLRAQAARAAMLLRENRPARAAAVYGDILDEYFGFARRDDVTAAPSYLQLVELRARALSESGHPDEATTLLSASLGELAAGSVPMRAVEGERFARFVTRYVSTRRDDSYLIRRLERLRRTLRHLGFREVLERAIIPRIQIRREPIVDAAEAPRRLREDAAGRHHLVCWTTAVTKGERNVIGFSYDLPALRAIVDRACRRSAIDAGTREAPDGTTTLDGASGEPDVASPLTFSVVDSLDSLPSISARPRVALAAPLDFLGVVVDEPTWRESLKRARRPFLIAEILIPILGAAMALAVVILYRGFRREHLLSKLKTDFVANVSHELKTPLALIRMFGETLMLDRVPDADRRTEYYGIITRESERLTHLINNVLDFASIEAGRKTYNPHSVDIGRIVSETLRSYQYDLDAKGFSLEQEIGADLPQVNADPDGVAQALINLINNAVNYSPEHKEIRVRVWENEDGVSIRVADRGVGIAADEQRRIFEGFYRSRSARKLGRRGSGLGLSLVRHIVQSHGGKIGLESTPGKGSAFTLTFPRESANGDSPADGDARS